MDNIDRTTIEPHGIPHPGETLQEYLEFYEWSQRDLARRTGITPKTISEIRSGKAPISPQTALAFEKVLQRPAHFWLNLQRQFDEAEARRRELTRSSHWTKWVGRFPLKEMRRLKFSLPEGRSDVDALLNYFGVSSPDSFSAVWKASAVAYRQTRTTTHTRDEALAAWACETELRARGLILADFNADRLRSSLDELRHFTRTNVDEALAASQKLCAQLGVAVVCVPALRNTGISGCARWLSDRKALVGLTLRFKTDDQLWFTFFHELGHLLLHRNERRFVLDNAAEDLSDRVIDPEMQQYETEASRFAADTLIPTRALAEFVRHDVFTNASVKAFAESIGVGPGIVVGRLQHDGVLTSHQGNALKQRVDWRFLDLLRRKDEAA